MKYDVKNAKGISNTYLSNLNKNTPNSFLSTFSFKYLKENKMVDFNTLIDQFDDLS